MGKKLAGISVLFVMAFVIGLAVAPGAVEKAYAGPGCGTGFCDYNLRCVKASSSCSACGGNPCLRVYDGRCSVEGTCCGTVVDYICGI